MKNRPTSPKIHLLSFFYGLSSQVRKVYTELFVIFTNVFGRCWSGYFLIVVDHEYLYKGIFIKEKVQAKAFDMTEAVQLELPGFHSTMGKVHRNWWKATLKTFVIQLIIQAS